MQESSSTYQPDILDTSLVKTVETGALSASLDVKQLDVMDVLLLLLPVLALSLWAISLHTVSYSDMNDLGLVSALKPGVIVAPGILVVGFILTLQRKKFRESFLALYVVCIILVLYAIPTVIEQLPSLYNYKHAGYTEYITRTGTVDPYIGIYFDVPGFFVLSAFFTKVFGYSTILEYAGWTPIFYNLIYLGPMYMIFTSITTNKRLVWLSLLFFYLTNWVGQDYFSPQGLNFFLYLVILAMLLKWFKTPPEKHIQLENNASFKQKFQVWLKAPDPELPVLQPWQRRGLLCCLIFIFGLVVFSHPLTPFFTILSVGLLVLFRRCYPLWLPILMVAMNAAWIAVMMQPYLSTHADAIIASIGDLTGNVPTSVTTGKMTSDALYQIVGKTRLYMTVLLWLLAFLGGIKRLRQGHRDITYILLAISGFPLIIAQSYGGEMLLRIYLFTEPFMVFFAAALFCENPLFTMSIYTRTTSTSLWRTIAIVVANLILLGGFFFTRYGDERANLVSPAEWNAVQYLYQIAPARSYIFPAWNDTPLFFEGYEKYDIQGLQDVLPGAVIHMDIPTIVQFVTSQKGGTNSYVLLTREQQIFATAWLGLPPDMLQRLEVELLKTGKFRVIYSNSDAQILQVIGTGS